MDELTGSVPVGQQENHAGCHDLHEEDDVAVEQELGQGVGFVSPSLDGQYREG